MKIFYDAADFWENAKEGDKLAPGVIKKCPPIFPKLVNLDQPNADEENKKRIEENNDLWSKKRRGESL